MTMVIPDGMPVLGYGAHHDPQYGACLMEYVSMLAGEPFTDHPTTAWSVLAAVGRNTNDSYQFEDVRRQALGPLAVRFVGTNVAAGSYRHTHPDVLPNLPTLAVELAIWAMGYAAQYIPEEYRLRVSEMCGDLRRTLDGGPEFDASKYADFDDLITNSAYSVGAGACKQFARAFTCSYGGDLNLTSAISCAVVAPSRDNTRSLAEGLNALLDEFDRLTGHKLTDTTDMPAPAPEPTNPDDDENNDEVATSAANLGAYSYAGIEWYGVKQIPAAWKKYNWVEPSNSGLLQLLPVSK